MLPKVKETFLKVNRSQSSNTISIYSKFQICFQSLDHLDKIKKTLLDSFLLEYFTRKENQKKKRANNAEFPIHHYCCHDIIVTQRFLYGQGKYEARKFCATISYTSNLYYPEHRNIKEKPIMQKRTFRTDFFSNC